MALTSFKRIEKAARTRLGDEELEARLPTVRSSAELRATPDDRYLAWMAERIFAAGFRWRVVRAKWPDIEAAFDGFDPATVAAYDETRHVELGNDKRVIRHMGKIGAIIGNSRAVLDMAEREGSVGEWLAAWPDDDTVGLWAALKTRFKMLGGASGPRFLRLAGRDTFVLTPDVLRALAHFGVYEGKGTGKRDQALIQAAFNKWQARTGHPQAHLSMMLAGSIE